MTGSALIRGLKAAGFPVLAELISAVVEREREGGGGGHRCRPIAERERERTGCTDLDR